jgi:serine/threonine protein kinase
MLGQTLIRPVLTGLRRWFGSPKTNGSAHTPATPRTQVTATNSTFSLINKTISRYKIIREIGYGATGEVYLAEDTKMGRQVALKILSLRYTADPILKARFMQEASLAAAIIHPNIIKTFELEEYESRPYIVTEYIDGKSLRDLIDKEDMSFDAVFDVTLQIGEGLRKAHQSGVVHRDLKPGNVLVDRDGWVRIIDFGLAKTQGDLSLTDTGVMMGTPNYMSPEQIRDAKNVDRRADIFSLGVMLYEMLTRQLPFPGKSVETIWQAILHAEPEPLARYKRGVSPGLQHVIDKALDKDLATRYQYIDELIADLKRERKALAKSPAPAQPAAAPSERFDDTTTQSGIPFSQSSHARLESPEAPVDPQSRLYVEREGDRLALEKITGQEVTMVLKGPRQIGKTSLLKRITAAASRVGKQVALLNFQEFDKSIFNDVDTFFRQFCALLTHKLKKADRVDEFWKKYKLLGNIPLCSAYLEEYLLKEVNGYLVLAMDEVDRLFETNFSDDFFGMLRAWNNRQTPAWKRLDLVLVTSTDPYLFISNFHQSPFNVGEVFRLQDFTAAQVAELNRRHDSPLRPDEVDQLVALVGGHPYLVRKALYETANRHTPFAALLANAIDELGPFGDHLRRFAFGLYGQEDLQEALRQVLRYKKCRDERIFHRLQGAGLIRQEGKAVVFRCQLYADFFREHFYGKNKRVHRRR